MDWQRPTCLGFGLNHATLLGQIYGFVLFCHIMTKVSYGFQMFVYLFRPSFLPSFLGWLAGWLFLSLSGFAAYLSKDPPSLHNPNPQSQSTRSITPPFRRGDVEGFFPASAGVWHGFLTGRFEHGV